MNDFSEIENELRKLRPAQPSPILFERIEEAMMDRKVILPVDRQPERLPYNWWSVGIGLAAAAALLLFAVLNMDRHHEGGKEIAQVSPEHRAAPVLNPAEESTSTEKFVPAGATRLVYNTRDEGLQFPHNSGQPLRRWRYQTRETWQWRNPTTGASLRVSYPSEEVVLIPVSGQ